MTSEKILDIINEIYSCCDIDALDLIQVAVTRRLKNVLDDMGEDTENI